MPLICRHCGTHLQDPGGDPRNMQCGVCWQFHTIVRVPPAEDKSKDAIVGAIAGAAFGSPWGPPGMLIGGLIGLFVGAARRDGPVR